MFRLFGSIIVAAYPHNLAVIASKLGIKAPADDKFTDDDIDAVICSLAAFAKAFDRGALHGESLKKRVTQKDVLGKRVLPDNWSLPKGYVLVDLTNPFWAEIRLTHA